MEMKLCTLLSSHFDIMFPLAPKVQLRPIGYFIVFSQSELLKSCENSNIKSNWGKHNTLQDRVFNSGEIGNPVKIFHSLYSNNESRYRTLYWAKCKI